MNIREALVELSVRYSAVLFPFRVESLVEALPQAGFVVPEPVEPQFYTRLGVSGAIGVKGDLKLLVHTDRRNLSVRGHEYESVIHEFEAVEELLEHRLGFSSSEHAEFYEIHTQAVLESTGRSPLAEIQRHFEASPWMGRFASVLGRPTTNLGYRLVPPGSTPNSPSWFDIQIGPEVLQPDRLYLVQSVFRDPSRRDVLALANRGFSVVEGLIQVIEGKG